jgi:predicted ATPase/class 3 adenylate cyclase
MQTIPSGTLTFLFTDIEGSTRLWETEPDLMGAALSHHDDIVRRAIESHAGYVFHTAGDAFGAAFASADAAASAAVDAQRELTTLDWGGPELRTRMSLHTGESYERDGDYFGPTLNQASRLVSLGHGGQILVSSATAALLRPIWTLLDLGRHRLRDVSEPLGVFQLEAPGLRTEFPELRSPDVVRSSLPTYLNSFIGRSDDVAALSDLLREHRLVTLVGAGGIGKTRLALHTAAELVDRYPDGVWVVELTSVSGDSGVADVVAGALSVTRTPERELRDDIVAFLRSRRVLLVLDNCEHVVEAVGALASAIVSGCAGVAVLATSREGLAVAGERVWPVAPLPAAGAAVALFADRAQELAPGFPLELHRACVEEICQRLDGLPLAIELAAAHVQTLAPTDIAALLDDRFRLLTGGRRSAVGRHRTLRATVEWSYDLLAADARSLFARLAIFCGWFDLAAVRAVCGYDPLDSFSVVESLEQLVAKSMVIVEDRREGRRYRMFETLRDFATEQLDAAEIATVGNRHASHYCSWVQRLRVELESPKELEALDELDDGWDNLRAANAWAVDHGDADLALGISAALVLEAQRRYSEVSAWARDAVELEGADHNPMVIDALVVAAQGHLHRRREHEAGSLLDRAEALCADRGWEPTSALYAARTWQAFRKGDLEGMEQWATLGVELARRRREVGRLARHLCDLSAALGVQDRGEEARDLMTEAVQLSQALGNPSVQLVTETQLVYLLPDFRQQLAPMRDLLVRAKALHAQELVDALASFVTGLEARAGDPKLAAAELRTLLVRLLDADVWAVWDYTVPEIFLVLVRNERYEGAAVVHGRADNYLAQNRSREHADAAEFATVARHLRTDQVAVLQARGRDMTPREMASFVVAELDGVLVPADR